MKTPYNIKLMAEGKEVPVVDCSIDYNGPNDLCSITVKGLVPWALGNTPPTGYVGPKSKIKARSKFAKAREAKR